LVLVGLPPVAVRVAEYAVAGVAIGRAVVVIWRDTGADFNMRVKAWEASVPTPLEAPSVIGKVPAACGVGVPERVAEPGEGEAKVIPAGSAPLSERVGLG